MDDLKLTPKDPEPPKVVTPPPRLRSNSADAKNVPRQPANRLPAAGKVSVSVDQLTKPGAIVSGKVTFSDGQTADWYLDQTGRLGVVPKQQGYKPSAADVQEFQTALAKRNGANGVLTNHNLNRHRNLNLVQMITITSKN